MRVRGSSYWICMILILGISATLGALPGHPMVGTDSTLYINSARNLAEGNGLLLNTAVRYDQDRAMAIEFGPVYPTLVAVADMVGIDPVRGAFIINVTAHTLSGVLIYLMLRRTVPSYIAGTTGASVVILRALVWDTVQVMTESLYLALVVVTIFCLDNYAEADCDRPVQWLISAALASALAVLTRYIGVALLVPISIAVLLRFRSRRNVRELLSHLALGCGFLLGSFSVWQVRSLLLFEISRRIPGSVYCTAADCPHSSLGEIAKQTIEVAVHSLVISPELHLGLGSALRSSRGQTALISAASMLLLWFATRMTKVSKRRIVETASRVLNPATIMMSYIAVHIWVVSYNRWTTNPLYVPQRYLSAALPLALAVAGLLLASLLNLVGPDRIARMLLTLCTGLIAVLFWIGQLQAIAKIKQDGLPDWAYNAPTWQYNEGLATLSAAAPPTAVIFSNRCEAVYLNLARSCRSLPFRNYPHDTEKWLTQEYPGGEAYVVWFAETVFFWTREELIEIDYHADNLKCYDISRDSVLCELRNKTLATD